MSEQGDVGSLVLRATRKVWVGGAVSSVWRVWSFPRKAALRRSVISDGPDSILGGWKTFGFLVHSKTEQGCPEPFHHCSS